MASLFCASDTRRGPAGRRIVIRVLEIDQLRPPLPRHVGLGRRLRQAGEGPEPGRPALDAILLGRRHPVRMVEAADGQVDPVALGILKGQRRAAGRAVVANRERRAVEAPRLAAGPGEIREAHWRKRETYLESVPGFLRFALLRGDEPGSYVSHSSWASREAFEAWTRSESFQRAHAQARAPKGTYIGHPQLEAFEVVL